MIRVKNNRYIHILAIISIFLFQVVFISNSMVMAADTQSKQYFVDNAGLVYEDKASEINDRLAGMSDEYDFDVVIYTSDDASLYDAETAADDFFDYNGYGVGADRSGVVLYINIKTGDRYISTKGFGIEAFTDAGIQYIGKQIKSDLDDGDYDIAFESFADYSEDFIKQAKEGKPYDKGNMPKGAFPFLKNLLISLAIGLIAALVYALILRGELKSVAPHDSAADYVKAGSVHVHDGGSIYLYSRVTKTPRQTDNSSSGGGGSSTHKSSSGETHGGGKI